MCAEPRPPSGRGIAERMPAGSPGSSFAPTQLIWIWDERLLVLLWSKWATLPPFQVVVPGAYTIRAAVVGGRERYLKVAAPRPPV